MVLRSAAYTSEFEATSWSPTIADEAEFTSTLVPISPVTTSAPSQKQLHLDKIPGEPLQRTNTPLQFETRERRKILAHWEGIVTIVEKNVFFAAARNVKSNSVLPTDELEIDLARVETSDRELVREGAIFYLTVGVRYPKGEGPQDFTQLIFRRMPRWSKQDIQRVESAADEFWKKRQAKRSRRPAEQQKIDKG